MSNPGPIPHSPSRRCQNFSLKKKEKDENYIFCLSLENEGDPGEMKHNLETTLVSTPDIAPWSHWPQKSDLFYPFFSKGAYMQVRKYLGKRFTFFKLHNRNGRY